MKPPRIHTGKALAVLGVLAMLAAMLGLAGCASSSSTAPQGPTARMERLGSGKVESVVLTPLGAARIGVQTAVATASPAGTAVPYSALLYEPNGATAVYVNTGALDYTRYFVTVAAINGNQVYLSSGLQPGEKVVSVGAEELLGVQNGVGVET
jgi:Flp pilus assembly protein CpaB